MLELGTGQRVKRLRGHSGCGKAARLRDEAGFVWERNGEWLSGQREQPPEWPKSS